MYVWADRVVNILKANEVIIYLLAKYVDDVDVAMGIIPKGWKWKEIQKGSRQLEYSQEAEEQDVRKGKSDAKRTMDLVVEKSSKVLSGIRFTADFPECNESGRIPVLDLEVWATRTEEGKARIRHTFYEKAIASPSVFHSKAAYGWRSKIVRRDEMQAKEHGLPPPK